MANIRWWTNKDDIVTLAATDRMPVTDDVGASSVDKYCTPAEIQTFVFSTAFSLNGKLTGGAHEIEGSNFDINGGTIDGVSIGASVSATYICVDNLILNGQTISTDANSRDIILLPNGTGSVKIATGDLEYAGTVVTATGAEMNLLDAGNPEAIYGSISSIIIRANSTSQLVVADGIIRGNIDNDIDLGSSTYEFKDLHLDGVAYIDNMRIDEYATISGMNYVADSGLSANNYELVLAPALGAYRTGLMVILKPHSNNTGACNLNVNSLGNTAIKIMSGGALANPAADDLDADGFYILIYDGTYFQLINPS